MRWHARLRSEPEARETATVPEVPRNAAYMTAAYIVTAVILLAYAVSLFRRARRR